jgi:hypothetical protein
MCCICGMQSLGDEEACDLCCNVLSTISDVFTISPRNSLPPALFFELSDFLIFFWSKVLGGLRRHFPQKRDATCLRRG